MPKVVSGTHVEPSSRPLAGFMCECRQPVHAVIAQRQVVGQALAGDACAHADYNEQLAGAIAAASLIDKSVTSGPAQTANPQ